MPLQNHKNPLEPIPGKLPLLAFPPPSPRRTWPSPEPDTTKPGPKSSPDPRRGDPNSTTVPSPILIPPAAPPPPPLPADADRAIGSPPVATTPPADPVGALPENKNPSSPLSSGADHSASGCCCCCWFRFKFR
ncbi:hypothetical protein N658DRAFT_499807 [Parathielavia hyrcaniae]|uniref:Uncharacterized protein n=1 Tax=Parathielavia hyrcaniae TaxID=113614 RepID=A0AAN6SY37_9PEZI|nr:hypothetical protein N658DRAFT_499807 [Parathielavia hyrcaniae]